MRAVLWMVGLTAGMLFLQLAFEPIPSPWLTAALPYVILAAIVALRLGLFDPKKEP